VSTPRPVAPPVVLPAQRDGTSTPAATRAGIYCRISRDKVGAGLGIARQESDCRVLADRLGRGVADVYADNDISAYGGKHRPQYERLLSDIRSGKVTAVLAWHGDRLHRRPTELESYIDACEARGVETQTVKAGMLDLSTPSGRMIARQLGTIARYEVEHGVERIKGAKAQARDAGQWLGGRAPFGYVKDGKSSLAPCTGEAELIRRAAEDVLAGRALRAVAGEWNAAGVTTRGGRRWDSELVRKVLCSPTTAGRIAHGGQDTGKAAVWPAIIDLTIWEGAAPWSTPSRRASCGRARRSGCCRVSRCAGAAGPR
jgi:DNA invertase Pin-like site-specific DNA recombinase